MSMEAELERWSRRNDTPMENSPVGLMMSRILKESPEMPFEETRKAAQVQLNKASGKRIYRPQTPKQEQTRNASTRNRLQNR